MNKICAIASLALVWRGTACSADVGTSSADFLRLGAGPRAVAMGEAQAGLADDVYATYWNPAGLAQLDVPEAGFVHTQYLQSITQQFAAYAQPTARWGTLAGNVSYLNVVKFQGYDAAAEPLGEVGAHAASVGLSYAKSVWDSKRYGNHFSLGVTGKWIHEQLDAASAGAYAADVGVLLAPGRRFGEFLDGWRAGLAVRNLGTTMTYDTESFPLPRTFDAGISYTGVWMTELMTLSLDAQSSSAEKPGINAGLELKTLQLVVLRAGYLSQSNLGNGLRLGAGLRFRTLQLDFAYGGAGDFGATYRIGLTFRFARPPQNPLALAEDWYEKGMKEYRHSQYADAMVDFNKALETDPSQEGTLEMMRKTYEQLKATLPR